jgi:prevent-host-death family protein
MDDKTTPQGPTTVGAYEAKTKFSELIARAEKGESFVVTKNGRPVARIAPMVEFDREKARQAVERLREFRNMQGPPVSEEEAQRNYEEMKRELDAEDDEHDDQWIDRWISSSTPR